MKHYAASKWNELGAIEFWGRNRSSAECISAGKRSYRQRERAVLKRMTEELVIEELGKYHNAEYWERELDELFGELQSLERAEERDWEFADCYGWEYHDSKFYQEAYRDLFARIDEVYGELAMVA